MKSKSEISLPFERVERASGFFLLLFIGGLLGFLMFEFSSVFPQFKGFVYVLLTALGLGIILAGAEQLFSENRIKVDADTVSIRRRGLFGVTASKRAVTDYNEVVLCEERPRGRWLITRISDSYGSGNYFRIELRLPGSRESVCLLTENGPLTEIKISNLRDQLEQWGKLLKLPCRTESKVVGL